MTTRSNIYKVLRKILQRRGFEERYQKRRKDYICLANITPPKYSDILCTDNIWFCHGLAFRMATYSCASEVIFERLECLMHMASNLEGWANESRTDTQWPKDYAKFFQRLWMLQCAEYYTDQGFSVTFAAKKKTPEPDLLVRRGGEDALYVECYFYSKWWPTETFIEEILLLSDPDLELERRYNLKVENFRSEFEHAMDPICEMLLSDKLEGAKQAAAIRYPVVLYEGRGMRVSLRGEGEYQPDVNNAHGCPTRSAEIYLAEIIKHKEEANNLPCRHTNCLMVNGLGIDYQMLFFNSEDTILHPKSSSIDSLILCRCGIDKRLSDSTDRFCLACEKRT